MEKDGLDEKQRWKSGKLSGGRFSAFDKPKAPPTYAAKFDDVNDDNWWDRVKTHAAAWDKVATLHKDQDQEAIGHWLIYLERYAPTTRNKVLDSLGKRGYYSFPDRFPWEFDIRYTKDEDWL